MRSFPHFNSSFDDVCPFCKTNKDCETVLVPIPGTEDGNICQARQVHKKCYDLILEMTSQGEDKSIVTNSGRLTSA